MTSCCPVSGPHSQTTGRIRRRPCPRLWTGTVSSGLCEWHNVAPLVYRALPAACPGAIPPAAMNRLRSLCHNNTARALFLASELSRILNALESCGIPAYPFKGPALSVMLYGDPARRQSKDLDILVPKERVRKGPSIASMRWDTVQRPLLQATGLQPTGEPSTSFNSSAATGSSRSSSSGPSSRAFSDSTTRGSASGPGWSRVPGTGMPFPFCRRRRRS